MPRDVVLRVFAISKHAFAGLAAAALRSPARRHLSVCLFGAFAIAILPVLPAPAPSPIHLVTTPAASPGWLDRLNTWRTSTGLPYLVENAAWSQGDYNHALYMVKNDLVAHSETPGVPYYTPEGDTAAQNGNIQVSSTTSVSDQQAIDGWMQAPFHAMGMMDPRLTQTGFGSYREVKSGWQFGATLDTLRGNSFSGGQYPVYFPGNGTTEPLTSYGGGESPDPLQACSGYSAPSGLPVFIQIGGRVATSAGPVHSFTGNGVALEHCVIDSTNPTVSSNLFERGAVIVIPRQPLQSGVNYVVALTVNGTPYTWSFTVGPFIPPVPCTSVTASAAPSSPTATGTSVTFTAGSTGCPNPRYRFWIQAPNGPWTIKQDYGIANSFVWNETGLAGSYGFEVDIRDNGEGNSVSYDVVKNLAYQLNGCSAVSLGANPASPQAPSGSVLLTATATCPGTPTYRFWIQAPGGPWTIKRDYGTGNTYSWSIAGLALGSYGLEVDVRNQGSTDSYEKVNSLTYFLGVAPCTTPTLGANPGSPGATGATINFTATTSACANPRYRFWVQSPNGPWVVKQDYSPINTFAWSGTGLAGNYGIEVDVRDQAESVSYDAVKNLTYALNGCSAVTLTSSPLNTAAHGGTVTLTATATCPGTPTYKFWIKAPGTTWTVVQNYGLGNTLSWTNTSSPINTATPGTYYIEVDVEDQGGTDTYEKVNNITYLLS